MAYNAGDIEAKLDLDRSPFITGLKEALQEAEKWKVKANKALTPKADIDRAPFDRALTAMQASLTKFAAKTYTAKVRIDDTGQLPKLTELNKRLTALAAKHAKPKVTVEVDDKQLVTLGNRIAQVGRDRKIKLQFNLTEIMADMKIVNQIIDSVVHTRYVHIDVIWSRAKAELTKLEMMLNSVTRDRTVNINVNVDKGAMGNLRQLGDGLDSLSSSADSGSEGMNRYTKRLVFLGSAITIAVAPALGVLSTALATIPFLAGAGAASFAVLQMGFDNFATAVSNPVTAAEIKRKQAALEALSPVAREAANIFENEVKPAFNNLQSDVQDKMFAGMAERFREMIALMPQVKDGLVAIAGGFGNILNQMMAVFTNALNLQIIIKMMNDFAGNLNALAPVFATLSQAFLTMASVGSQTFFHLVDQLRIFADFWNDMINRMASSGILAEAFEQLAKVTGALLIVFTKLMEEGFKMMVALGPSLTMFITTIGDLFVAMSPLLTQISKTFMDLMVPAMNILIILFNTLGPPIIRILDVLGNAFVSALNALMPLITSLATVVGDVLFAAIKAIEPIFPVIVQAIMDFANALVPLVNGLGPLLVQFIQQLAPMLPELADLFLQIVQAAIKLIPPLTQLVLAILPVLIDIMGLLMKVLIPVASFGIDLMAGLVNGIVTGVSWVLQVIADVVTWIIDTVKSLFGIASPSTVFAEFGMNLLQGLINGMMALVGAVVAFFTGIWNTIRDIAVNAWNAISQALTTGVQFFANLWNTVWSGISNFFTTIWTGIQNFATTVWNTISAFFTSALNTFTAFWSSIWNGIINFFTTIWNGIKTQATVLWNAIYAFYMTALNAWSAFWSNLWNGILNFFITLWNNLYAQAMALWNLIYAYYQAQLNAWNTFWQTIWNAISTFFTTIWNTIQTAATAAWALFKAFFDTALNAFTTFWSDTWNGIKTSFESIFQGIVEIAKRIWENVKTVFRDSINAVIKGVNWPIDKINGLFGISIPKLPEIGGLATGGTVNWSNKVPDAPIGAVRGPGGPTDDKVLTRLSNKEHVWSAKEVAAAGGHEAVARMRNAVLHQSVNKPTSLNPQAIINPANMGNSRMSGQQRLNLMKRPNMDDAGTVMLAYGGVQPHVAEAGAAVERQFGPMPGGIGGVGSRPNASDHPGGLALDFMTLSDTGLANRVADFLTRGWGPMSIKYLITQQRISQTPGAWTPMEDRGSITANHMDHVHASFLGKGEHAGGPGFFSVDYGAIFDSLAGPFKPLGENFLRGLIPNPPVPNWIEDMGVGTYNKGWDGLRQKAIELMQTVVGWLGGGGSSGGSGGAEQWRPAVLAALARVGQPASMADMVLARMNKESGGNPRAINNWDSNAARGTPSKGLMQVIDPTFQTHRDPGLPNDIWDPMANITASMRYTISRYGSLAAGYNRAGGYDSGGMLQPGWTMAFNGTNKPEPVLTSSQWDNLIANQQTHPASSNNTTVVNNDFQRLENLMNEMVEILATRSMGNTIIQDQSGNPQETARQNILQLQIRRGR